ncbi:LysR family transcriptional regulator (plasmid) [Azospirillum oryzae]|uniref:LysR family transcriptional regulator n=1 Tax=Azospirillum oryzae TaxID=286727 RepID=A0A6N1AUK5_9PROT|nr:LysR family transcriptional regulator [Azospirillum oryzae]KAA0587042.1 LysR family transcriptional regulator [Azospirillum oryzae]QKS54097.1 LysR family transcriptional regulator [Azospirillum oryzae]GLR82102.1 LysR family transcriptional regulator [Azospirillum oryzae]
MRGLNLDQLITFATVVEHGGFTEAAGRLGLTQPAVSMQIRNLEERFGVRLVERVGKRALPTAAGRDLLPYIRRLREEMEAAAVAMGRHRAGQVGRVRIGTGATACIYRLPPILTALRSAHPGLEIIVVTGNTPDILDAVEGGSLDLALVTLPAGRPGLSIEPVCAEELVCVGPGGDPCDAARSPAPGVAPAALADQTLILYERGGTMRAVIDGWFMAGGIQPRPAMELGNVEAIKNLVAAGLGRSILPSVTVGSAQDCDRFAVQPLMPPLIRKLGLVLRRDKVRDAGVRAMVKAITDMR